MTRIEAWKAGVEAKKAAMQRTDFVDKAPVEQVMSRQMAVSHKRMLAERERMDKIEFGGSDERIDR